LSDSFNTTRAGGSRRRILDLPPHLSSTTVDTIYRCVLIVTILGATCGNVAVCPRMVLRDVSVTLDAAVSLVFLGFPVNFGTACHPLWSVATGIVCTCLLSSDAFISFPNSHWSMGFSQLRLAPSCYFRFPSARLVQVGMGTAHLDRSQSLVCVVST